MNAQEAVHITQEVRATFPGAKTQVKRWRCEHRSVTAIWRGRKVTVFSLREWTSFKHAWSVLLEEAP
jgi:hypothetical protein